MHLVVHEPQMQLDQLLELVCIELQLTDTQYDSAETSYRTVAGWLSVPESGLAHLSPDIYPQGSMALGTTVKPRGRVDFDVDAVCLLTNANWRIWRPAQLYALVRDRLLEHATYAKMLQENDRCLTLDYAGQFHLDIIPACPAPLPAVQSGQHAIVIPEKGRTGWVATNPKGFAEWFTSRALPPRRENLIAMSIKPLPENEEAGSKTILQRITQLSKRRRDVHFDGSQFAPKSILITAIGGIFYQGEESLSEGIVTVLDRLIEVGRSHAGRTAPEIMNPSNPGENLARHWQEDPQHFEKFIEYVTAFREGMDRLIAARSMEQVAVLLEELFDPKGTSGAIGRAVKAYSERFQQTRRSGELRLQKIGTTLTTTAAPQAIRFGETKFWGPAD